MIGKSNNKPVSLVTGMIINIPATIWKIEIKANTQAFLNTRKNFDKIKQD